MVGVSDQRYYIVLLVVFCYILCEVLSLLLLVFFFLFCFVLWNKMWKVNPDDILPFLFLFDFFNVVVFCFFVNFITILCGKLDFLALNGSF